MFEFIKSLFKRNQPVVEEELKCPFLVHADINESIVIKEVALTDVKPKVRKTKVTTLKEVKPAKSTDKPKVSNKTKAPTKADALSNIVQLVPPTAKKKGRPKKDKV